MDGGIRGRLISEAFAREVLPSLPGATGVPVAAIRALEAWAHRCDEQLGPASAIRAIADVAVVPLLRILGYSDIRRVDSADACALEARVAETRLAVLVTAWSEPLAPSWRRAILSAVAADARWCFCCNGRLLRVVDARRTWSRDYLEIGLPPLAHESWLQALLWQVASAEAMNRQPPLLDRAVELSHRYGLEICRALGVGVLDALQLLVGSLSSHSRHSPGAIFEQSLTVLYRILFLLFAEARGVVPVWHPVYRDQYSLDGIVSALLAGRRCRGLWRAVRAISHLAHQGCAAGELKVTAFNGRLFSPVHSTAFDGTPVADAVLASALVAITTTPVRHRSRRRHGGRSAADEPVLAGEARKTRIAYRDLDVEQLGTVYEQVLEYEPASAEAGHVPRAALTRTSDVRKSTGAFYTPRAVTAFLVRRTLEPLTRDRSAAEILGLRIVDPAMGSGAFLVGACRYLAAAVEKALIADGTWHPHDVTAGDRATIRREIASRCLYGVDLNPMAVQLARLSLWLATLAADKPLSFLDHHLLAGDSLIGATPSDLARRRTTRSRIDPLPLFDSEPIAATLQHAVGVRLTLAADPDDSAAVVRSKEQMLAALHSRNSTIGRWSRVLDLWCAGWFWDEGSRPDSGVAGELSRHILHGRSALADHVARPLLAHADDIARRRTFLHWPLAFPEVFVDSRGEPLLNPGFDAVIGNPPWDMVRGDSGSGDTRVERRVDSQYVTSFVRESGIYRLETKAHVNRYQLFVERALQLTRPTGRIGLVLPSGLAGDAGAASLRRHLFDRAEIDHITGIDNRAGVFPIHRGLRLALVTCTAGRPTSTIRCRFGVTRAEELDAEGDKPIELTRAFIERLSGADDLGIPELTSARGLRLVEQISASTPRLGDAAGWGVRFGRELNATDDRAAFVPFTGDANARPVIEGKLVDPFRVAVDRCRLQVPPHMIPTIAVPRRVRVAYRDVASATNRLTLIAALVPARAVTTHTLFCLKTPLAAASQQVLCALLNSFVANYLVRLRVNTHVTVSLVARLPVPLVATDHPAFNRLASLARTLIEAALPVEDMPEYAELQALVARLYRLETEDFEYVLSTFPLIPERTRTSALTAFIALR